jgi:RNA polymerase sigma-70 factor, ECF subfamily
MKSAAMLEEVGPLQHARSFSMNVIVLLSRALDRAQNSSGDRLTGLRLASDGPHADSWRTWSAAAPITSVDSGPGWTGNTPRPGPDDVASTANQAAPDAVLHELMTDHLQAMYRVARAVVHDGALAEDVVQEALLKAWQAASTFRGESSLRSWALRITHNTGVSVLRRRREELRDPGLLPETEHAAGTDRQVQGRLMVEQLWKALDQLDPLSRTIVVLREIESMSYEDISESLDVPLPTVKTRLFRARRILATDLGGWTE